MRIQFCGAAGEVTGSCTKVTVENQSILVDCGLFQGAREDEAHNTEPFPFIASEIDAVVVTHAHLDHCGRLPKLVNAGFQGRIYATDATRDLVHHILIDSAGIQESQAEERHEPPLYTESDVMDTMARFVPVAYDMPTQITEQFKATFYNAGHVLGSSFIRLEGGGKTIIFSGDIGNYPVPLLPKAEDLPKADALVLESTYGNKGHAAYADGIKVLEQAIRDTVHDKGVLLVPAFSLERTQELLTALDKALGAHEIPVISAYVDSPLGNKITRVYEKYERYYKPEARARADHETDHDLLRFPHLVFTDTVEQSKMINNVPPPKMIIAGSGMMHGGRILHHLERYVSQPNTRLLVVGYQAKGTLGREIIDGARKVRIYGAELPVRAKVVAVDSFSSHMDQHQVVRWVETMPTRPEKVFLNHGDDNARAELSKILATEHHFHVEVPRLGQAYTV